MPKKQTCPHSRHIVSRIECMIESHQRARTALENIRDSAIKDMAGGVRAIVVTQLNDALAAIQLASDAISGMDQE